MKGVGDLADDGVILVQYDDVTPRALSVQSVDSCHSDTEVDQP